jgi:hypothetical protein
MEIESETVSEAKPFCYLERSFEKWKPQLKPTSHNTGLWVLAPQIISDKFADDKKRN